MGDGLEKAEPDVGTVLHHPLGVGAMRPTPIIEIGCAGIDTAVTGNESGKTIR